MHISSKNECIYKKKLVKLNINIYIYIYIHTYIYIYIYILIKDDELLKHYNESQEKVKNSTKKEFDVEPVNNEKNLKTERKSYNGKIDTNFHSN